MDLLFLLIIIIIIRRVCICVNSNIYFCENPPLLIITTILQRLCNFSFVIDVWISFPSPPPNHHFESLYFFQFYQIFLLEFHHPKDFSFLFNCLLELLSSSSSSSSFEFLYLCPILIYISVGIFLPTHYIFLHSNCKLLFLSGMV